MKYYDLLVSFPSPTAPQSMLKVWCCLSTALGFPGGTVVKNAPANVGETGD